MTMPNKPDTGAAWTAWGAFIDALIRGASSVGKSLLQATDAPAARSAIGLGAVNNTADADKPVSTAQAQAIADLKAKSITAVNHDGTSGGGTRPSGWLYVIWRGGTTRPTNMVANVDEWVRDAA